MRVKDILKEKGMTAKALAAQIGISEGALSQQLAENSNPSLRTLEKIASALGVSVGELFEPRGNFITCPHCGGMIHIVTVGQ